MVQNCDMCGGKTYKPKKLVLDGKEGEVCSRCYNSLKPALEKVKVLKEIGIDVHQWILNV